MERLSDRRWRRFPAGVVGHPWRILVTALIGTVLVAFLIGAVDRGAGSTHGQLGLPKGQGHGAGTGSPPSPSRTVAGSGGIGTAMNNAAAGTGAGSSGAAGQSTTSGGAPSVGGASGPTTPPLPSGSTGQSAKIEETGSLTLIVPGSRIQQDLARLSAIATGSGGFVATSELDTGAGSVPSQGTITLQVPQAEFQAVVAQARGLGKVSSLNSQATDVTGQYVDLQARISALEASREQYLTIMAKATSIGDVLNVQNQLDNLQQQIEQLQGQLNVLHNQTTYATLSVALTPKGVPTPVPESGLASAWHSAVSGFAAGFDGVVRVAGPLLFVLLLLGALVAMGRGLWHVARNRKPAAT